MVAHNQRYEAGEVSWWRKVTEHYDLTMEEIEKALGLGTIVTIFRSVLTSRVKSRCNSFSQYLEKAPTLLATST